MVASSWRREERLATMGHRNFEGHETALCPDCGGECTYLYTYYNPEACIAMRNLFYYTIILKIKLFFKILDFNWAFELRTQSSGSEALWKIIGWSYFVQVESLKKI